MDVATITILIILALNLTLTLVYVVQKFMKKEPIGIALFFLFLPIFGFLIYYLPYLIQKICGNTEYDRDSLVQRINFEKSQEPPSIETELNVVPIGDAMVASSNAAKRALLLEELKKDIHNNYRVLLAAGEDSDSESVHYVAAAKMEVHRLLQERWMRALDAYEDYPDDAELFYNVTDSIKGLIDSSLLSEKEQRIFRKKYCTFLQKAMREHRELPRIQDYSYYLVCLTKLGKKQDAIEFWNQEQYPCKDEASFFSMMELYYDEKNQNEFYNTLEELSKEDGIRLSPEGLSKMRYWISRKEELACCL